MAREHHLAPAERPQAYADAIFSIVATIMILPLSGEAVKEIADEENLLTGLGEMWFKLLIYAISFFLVSSSWEVHTWIFRMIEKVNETIVLLNLLAILLHAHSRPNLLKKEFVQQGKEEMKLQRTRATIKVLITPIIYLIAIPVSYGSIEVKLQRTRATIKVLITPIIYLIAIPVSYGSIEVALMFAGFLPIVFKLTGEFGHLVQIALIAVFILLKLVRNWTQLAILLHAHSRPNLLKKEFVQQGKEEMKLQRTRATIKVLITPIIYLIAIPVSYGSIEVALMFAGFLPIVFKLTGEFGHLAYVRYTPFKCFGEVGLRNGVAIATEKQATCTVPP
uniref:Endosomal/lysosomal proton channel TMEM175 n=1 Tax=Branchiostoma floridae TaxID=7739 RepID=C3Z622_BRAFL|eukprot:XP_002596273.1 hypothetical protein BRAFLDRAFT_65971 [Branchiostoma floridae]